MFLFSINASSERNRDHLCKTMWKIFHYKSRTGDRHVETNKSHVDINSSRLEIEVTLFKKLFWLWCSRKEWSESFTFIWGVRRLENPAAKESSDLFGLPAPLYVRQYLSTNSKSLFVPFDLQFYHWYYGLVYAQVLRLSNLSDVCLNNSG